MFDRRDYMFDYNRKYKINHFKENAYKPRVETFQEYEYKYYRYEIIDIINRIEKEGFINGSRC